MIDSLTGWMSLVSNHLLPVVLFVITLMSCAVLILLGGFLRELGSRRTTRAGLDDALVLAKKPSPSHPKILGVLEGVRRGVPARFMAARRKHGTGETEGIFNDLDGEIAARLALLSLLTRLGPMGGLIATLLPLGPALHALARGDMGDLAGNLTIAFTATVVGLCVSCLAYAMGLVRRTWYTRDMNDLEAVTALLPGGEGQEASDG